VQYDGRGWVGKEEKKRGVKVYVKMKSRGETGKSLGDPEKTRATGAGARGEKIVMSEERGSLGGRKTKSTSSDESDKRQGG